MKTAYKYTLTNCTQCFINTHNRHSSAQEKEITYRLLYNITPIRPTIRQCPFCKRHTFNEEHLYTQCTYTLPIRNSLLDTLEALTQEDINIHKSIMLNIFPATNNSTKQLIVHLLGKYRYMIWTAYCKAQHEHTTRTAQQLDTTWNIIQNNIIYQHIH